MRWVNVGKMYVVNIVDVHSNNHTEEILMKCSVHSKEDVVKKLTIPHTDNIVK